MNRNVSIVVSVLVFHAVALWALQTGLLRRMAEAVAPAEILVEIMPPATPAFQQPVPQPQPKMQAKAPTPQPVLPTPAIAPQPAPAPLAIAPSATAPAATAAAPTAIAATPAVTQGSAGNAPSAPAAPARVELPSSSADYLNNPKPPYPALSKRLGEQGRVVVRAWIGTDGMASQVSVKQSSGFDRLDQAAVATVLKWRYVPGKRGGVPEAMWFDVPVNWVLQ